MRVIEKKKKKPIAEKNTWVFSPWFVYLYVDITNGPQIRVFSQTLSTLIQ